MKKEEQNVVNEPNADYHTNFDAGELSLLKEGLNRSYKERFEFATRLYKIQMTMKGAAISHKPFIKK